MTVAPIADQLIREMDSSIRPVDVSVVAPLLDERDSLAEFHQEVVAALDLIEVSFELIFVDDGSTDGSFAEIERLHRSDPRIRAVRFRVNHGKSAALAEGFRHARGRVIVTIDADLQDVPAEIPRLLAELRNGRDLVCAWRADRQDRFTKRVTSRFFNYVTSAATGVRLHDFNCGLKAFRREVVESVRLYGQLHRYLPALAANQGFVCGEVRVSHRPRKHGTTKYGPGRFKSGAFDLLTSVFLHRYGKSPLHFFGAAGGLFLAAGLAVGVPVAWRRIVDGRPLVEQGPLLLLSVIVIGFAFQCVAIGLLGEMVLESRKDSLRYPIERTLG